MTDIIKPETLISQEDAKDMYDIGGILGISEDDLAGYDAKTSTLSALISGLPKVGKTKLCGTSNLPILFYSFDPKSTVVLHQFYPELMKKRWIVVIPFWDDGGYKAPQAYRAWEKIYENHKNSGFLNRFGTVVIDSYTSWLRAAGNEWLYQQNQKRANKKGGKQLDQLAQGDYPGLYNLSSVMIHELSSGSWNFLLTCHLNIIRDEESGIDTRVELLVYKSLKTEIPSLFSENYILTKRPSGPGSVEYILLTDASGIYNIAGSQLRKDGILSVKEIPNFRHLFKKAGVNYKDLPHWKTGEKLNKDDLPEEIAKYL